MPSLWRDRCVQRGLHLRMILFESYTTEQSMPNTRQRGHPGRGMRLAATLVLLALSVPASAMSAQRAARPCETTEGLFPTTLTVEGGGSLGVYEAGMTYVLVEVFRRKWLNSDATGVYAQL